MAVSPMYPESETCTWFGTAAEYDCRRKAPNTTSSTSDFIVNRPETATPEHREVKKWKFSFFRQRHALWTGFDIFVVTYRVTNFLPELVDMLLFSTEKN